MADLAAGRTPQVQRSSEEQARVQAAITALFEEHISFNKLLGLKVQSLAADDLRVGFDMQPQWVGHFSSGRLHGGVTAAVLDATCGLALMAALAERHNSDNAAQVLTRIQRMGTIDLRVDYLRAGVGKRFVVSSNIVRLGGHISAIQASMRNEEGLLIATGAAAYFAS